MNKAAATTAPSRCPHPSTPSKPTEPRPALHSEHPAPDRTQTRGIDVSRLDAIDHKDVLESLQTTTDVTPCCRTHAGWLATIFEAAVRLLANDDHTRRSVPLALTPTDLACLGIAHQRRASEHNDPSLAVLHEEYADALSDKIAHRKSGGIDA